MAHVLLCPQEYGILKGHSSILKPHMKKPCFYEIDVCHEGEEIDAFLDFIWGHFRSVTLLPPKRTAQCCLEAKEGCMAGNIR